MSRRPAFVLVNAFSSRNAGDAAIVLATAELVRRLTGGGLTSATRYHDDDHDFYAAHGVATVPPVIPFRRRGGSSSLARAAGLLAGLVAVLLVVAVDAGSRPRALALARRLRLAGLVELLRSDGAIVCGGGYLYSARRRLNLTLIHACLTVWVCGRVCRRTVMMPQSIGPFTGRFDRWLVGVCFRRVGTLVARDPDALAEAGRIARPGQGVTECPDVAFAGWSAREHAATGRPVIAFAPMDWTWARPAGDEALEAYSRKLAEVVRRLDSEGCDIQFFGNSRMPEMGQDDLEVSRRVAELSGVPVAIDPDDASGDPVALAEAFTGADVVIGTRLHSCLIALSVGTPAIALGYQPKSEGAYAQMGIADLCLDVEGFEPAEVTESTVRLLADAEERDRVLAGARRAETRIEELYGDLLAG